MSEAHPKPERFGETTLGKALGILAGSNSPSYVQLHWHKISAEDFMDPEPFIEFDGDSEAWPWPPRLWKKAGLLTIPAAELEQTKADHPKLSEAVAYMSPGGVIRAACMPEGGFAEDLYNPSNLVVAGRIGRGALRFMAGLWAPGRPFAQPPGITIHPDGVSDISGLPTRFPDQKMLI